MRYFWTNKFRVMNRFAFSLFFVSLLSGAWPLLGQGLRLDNYKGKIITIPYGREIIVDAQQNGGKDYLTAEGKLINAENETVDLKLLYLEKTVDCNNPAGFVSTVRYSNYQDNRNFSIPFGTIDKIEIPRESAVFNRVSMQLVVMGAAMAFIAAPVLGAFDRSGNGFLQSGPGRLSIVGSGVTITGLIMYASRPKNKKYPLYVNENGEVIPGKTWRILP
jgi:hypothetical protein